MSVPVMDIWEMGVPMTQRGVRVLMGVRLFAIPIEGVRVPMMLVVSVRMRVGHRLVNVLMLVLLSHMQPHTATHADRRQPERGVATLPGEHYSSTRPDKRSSRKIGSSTRRPQVTQGHDEQHEAQAVPEKTYQQRHQHVREGW
jgi:hypothetical protein